MVEEDGEHVPMFFLRLPDGGVRPQLFDAVEQRPVGVSRAREMADGVQATGADAVAVVSEAWAADVGAIPDGGRAGDAPGATDLLLVAAIDREDNLVVFETPVRRGVDGSVELGASSRQLDQVLVFDLVREVWRTRSVDSS